MRPTIHHLSVLVFFTLAALLENAIGRRVLFLQPNVDRQYTFDSTVRLNEVNKTNSANDLVFRTTGNLQLSTLWQNPNDQFDKIFQLELSSLKILLQDDRRENTTTRKFANDAIKSLDDAKNHPFLVRWNNFQIPHIYLNPDEDVSLRNIKKAVASLFQFRIDEQVVHVEEADICGNCSVTYQLIEPTIVLKTKTQCISHLPDNQHPEKMLGTSTKVQRKILYQMNDDLSEIAEATLYENVDLSVAVKQEYGASAVATMRLNFIGTSASSSIMSRSTSVEEALNETINQLKFAVKPETLHINAEPIASAPKPLAKAVNDNREYLRSGNLGNVKSASAFLAVLKSVHASTRNEIIKILKNKKNEPILEQFMDILGSAQTLQAHKAVMDTFNFVKPVSLEPLERYLWSLSVARKPKIEFVRDLKNIIRNKPTDEKLLESLVLCMTAMAQKISKQAASDAYTFILDRIAECPPDDSKCIITYVRALKNLKNPDCKSVVLKYALNGTRSVSVNALKVLYALPPYAWDEEILKAMEKIYYQKDKKYDSSARVIAVDILLEANPDRDTLTHLLRSLQSNVPYEIRKYLLQRLNQIASTDEKFSRIFNNLMRQENLNHYGVIAQRGLSNAMTRIFSEEPSVNATLFCINEVSKGVLKRGHVSVSLQRFDDSLKIGSLDIFTGGLSSFLWSDDTTVDDELDEAEELTAGLEASVLGVQIRPFVFFNGHGELMGHIWSGTASEKTTALQGTALLHEADQMIALATGNILKFQLTGAGSYDLSGQIQFSLWNRNAHAFVEAVAGGSVEGTLNISSSFVKNGVDFKVYSQQKGEMTGDLDFYDEMAFCLRISQLESVVRFKGEKYQKLVDTEFARKQRKQLKLIVPGRTFALNQKNNEMCNDILKNRPS